MKLLNELLLLELNKVLPVHVNANGELKVLLDLIEKDFSVSSNTLYQQCLFAQSCYVIAAKLNLHVQEVADQLDAGIQKLKKKGSTFYDGITPDTVIKSLDQKKIVINGKPVVLHIGFETFTSVPEILSAIDQGHPVIIPINNSSGLRQGLDSMEDIGDENAGKVDDKFKDVDIVPNTHDDTYHALLAVGYDNGDKTIIVRENRSRYAYKGYAKIPFEVAKAHIKMTFTFTVDIS